MDKEIYRPDIDGLRAVAVISVLLFHLEVSVFSGGYVGVDVFFVISGFLITRLILDDLTNNCFSYANFYIRRVRRLFPALLFTLIFVLLCGYFIFRPFYYAELAQSAIYALLSLSNFLFWSQSGYFDSEVVLKPLLHTWSLSVEEQFYMVWPLMLVTAYKLKNEKAIFIVLIVLCILSFLLSQFWLRSDVGAAFYLMPSRVFELCLGGMCLWLCRNFNLKNSWNEIVFLSGLCLIGYSIFSYNINTAFPGFNALLPCIGAGLVIFSGNAKFSGKLLRNKISVYVGRISYSLYLIHWPIYSFYRYYYFDEVDLKGQIIIVILSFLLSAFMYECIERPFRFKKIKIHYLAPSIFSLRCALIALIFTFTSAHIWANNGFTSRINKEIKAYVGNTNLLRNNHYVTQQNNKDYPSSTRKNGLIIGDSHATDLLNALIQNEPRIMLKRRGVSIKCQPMFGARPNMSMEESQECDRRFLKLLESNDVKGSNYILLSSRWRKWSVEKLPETLGKIREYTNAKIILFGPSIEFRPEIPDLIFHHKSIHGISKFAGDYRIQERFELNQEMKQIASQNNIDYVDKISILCNKSECPIMIPDSEQLIYVDYGHWSMSGALWFGLEFEHHYPEIANLILK